MTSSRLPFYTMTIMDRARKKTHTQSDSYPNDHCDPMNFPNWKKGALTLMVALATLAVAFVSSAYTDGVD